MSRSELLLNAFEMNTVGHLAHGLWRHPRDRSRHYHHIGYWQSLARTLEAGLFDGLFLADVTGVYDVYGGSADAALRHAIQLPINDPLPLVPAMAAVTQHLGFGVTVNIGNEQPHLFARRMSTLDHLSGGRLGWNIVTGFLDSAARAAGQSAQTSHDERYARADDFMDAVYKLWEASWDDNAVRADAEAGVYTDPSRVRRIRHEGPWYRVDGVHLSAPSPQRTPVLYQAGASERGTDFAVKHAECIFLPNQGPAATAALVKRLRSRLVEAGRAPEAARILTSIEVIVAATDAEARDKADEYARYAQPQAALAQFAAATGIDFSRYEPDEPIRAGRGDGIRSAHDAVVAGDAAGAWTVRRLLDGMRLGGRFDPIVGSPSRVADELLRWADESGVDGFNLVRTVTPECFEDFGRLVVPELQSRGRFKQRYADGTLREKLFGPGRSRLPASHAGAAWRPSHSVCSRSPILSALPAFSETAERIRDDGHAIEVARALAADFAAGAIDRDRHRRLPAEEVERFSRSGLWAITVPREFGGAEVSHATLSEVTAIVSEADPSLGQIPQNHFCLVDAIRLVGTREQQHFFFSQALNGKRFGNAVSETGTPNSKTIKTRLTRTPLGLRLNGRKAYSTGALFAHWVPVAALDDDERQVLVYVDRTAPGLTVQDDWSGFGQRTTASGTVLADNVSVQPLQVVARHRLFEPPTIHGAFAQLLHSAIDLGIARAALADLRHWVRERARPWADSGVDRASQDPLTLHRIGELVIRLHAAEALQERAARFLDASRDSDASEASARRVTEASIAVAEAKVLTTTLSIDAASVLIELAGTQSTLESHALDRHWRNARTHTVHDPLRWKYHAVGNHWLNDAQPRRHASL